MNIVNFIFLLNKIFYIKIYKTKLIGINLKIKEHLFHFLKTGKIINFMNYNINLY